MECKVQNLVSKEKVSDIDLNRMECKDGHACSEAEKDAYIDLTRMECKGS